jgi:hypothetical protein
MRFTFINQSSRSEQESDYETAVDMSHWSFHETIYTLKTPTGLLIDLVETDEHVTHSYYEPDFEHMDKTGETVYEQHRDSSNDKNTQTWRATVSMPMKLPLMNVQDFLHLDLMKHNPDKAYEFSNQAKLWDYQEFVGGYCEEETTLSLSHDDIRNMMDQIYASQVKKGFSIDLTLSSQAENTIKETSAEHFALQNHNLETRLNNRCAEAEYHLTQKLDTLMKEAMEQLKEQWQNKTQVQKKIKP